MGEFIKRFKEWFALKPELDQNNQEPPFIKERDMWWTYLGENIGTEVSGKGEKFSRPVIVLKKLSRYTYLVVPLSTKIKEGSWFVKFKYQQKELVACLHQIRVIDYRRFDNRMGAISKHDFKMVKEGFKILYK